jgi:hypothetical protein
MANISKQMLEEIYDRKANMVLADVQKREREIHKRVATDKTTKELLVELNVLDKQHTQTEERLRKHIEKLGGCTMVIPKDKKGYVLHPSITQAVASYQGRNSAVYHYMMQKRMSALNDIFFELALALATTEDREAYEVIKQFMQTEL